MEVDILAFGAHPDDCEIGIGGTLAYHSYNGYRVGICDLTRGEMSTNGTVEVRRGEAMDAAEVLKLKVRDNIGLPDGFVKDDDEEIKKVISIIRKYRPNVVMAPHYEDHHPDHINASKLIKKAAHLSGLKEFPVEGEKFRPDYFYYYYLGYPKTPWIVVDTTGYEEIKLKSIASHKSQLGLKGEALETRLTKYDLLKRIEARDRHMGYFIDAEFGEGIVPQKAFRTRDLVINGG